MITYLRNLICLIALVCTVFSSLLSQSTAPATSISIMHQQCLGGSSNDEAVGILRTNDGGFLIAARTSSDDGDLVEQHRIAGNADSWIIKYNAAGQQQWSKCYGGSDSELDVTIIKARNGGYTFVTNTSSEDGDVQGWHPGISKEGQREIDWWVVHIDSLGVIQWQRCIGGSGGDIATSICTTPDGGYTIVGCTNSRDGDVVPLPHVNKHRWGDAWIVHLDKMGNIEWQRCFGGTGHDAFSEIEPTDDGGYIVLGHTTSTNGDLSDSYRTSTLGDLWVLKIDKHGAIIWQRRIGGSGHDVPRGNSSILSISKNTFIITARSSSIDGDATPTGNRDHDSALTNGQSDAWILWLNSNGTIIRQHRYGGIDHDEGLSLSLLSDGSLIGVGSTKSSEIAAYSGAFDGWILHLDSLGNLQSQLCTGGNDSDFLSQAILLSDSVIVVVGSTGSSELDGFHAGEQENDKHPPDILITWLKLSTTKQSTPTINKTSTLLVSVLPNPTSGFCELSLPQQFHGDIEVEVFDVAGKSLYYRQVSGAGNILPLNLYDLPTGTYTITLANAEQRTRTQVVIRR